MFKLPEKFRKHNPVNDGHQKIKIDFSEWPLVCEAVDRLRKEWVSD